MSRLSIDVYENAQGLLWCEWDGDRYEAANIWLLDMVLDRGLVPSGRDLHFRGKGEQK